MNLTLHNLLNEEQIVLVDSVEGWQQSIVLAAAPLIKQQKIAPCYVDAIMAETEKLGPYYVLAPEIAMPHARPEQGVIDNGLSLLIVRNGVNFDSHDNDPVRLIMLLAAKGSDQHIQLITSISEFFCNQQDINDAIHAQSPSEIIKILKKY